MKDTCATIDSKEKCLDLSHWKEISTAEKLVSGFNHRTCKYHTNFNKQKQLPVTKDVQALHLYLKEESENIDYRTFAEICLALIITFFNRKRSG